MRVLVLFGLLFLVSCSPQDSVEPDPPFEAVALTEGFALTWADGSEGLWRRLYNDSGQAVGLEFHLCTLKWGEVRWTLEVAGSTIQRIEDGIATPIADPTAILEEMERRLRSLWGSKVNKFGEGRRYCSLQDMEVMLRRVRENCALPQTPAAIDCAYSMAELQYCLSELQFRIEEVLDP